MTIAGVRTTPDSGDGLSCSSDDVVERQWSKGLSLFGFVVNANQLTIGMIDYYETRSQPITRKMVRQAYQKIELNKGSFGVDKMDWIALDRNPEILSIQTLEST